MQPNSSLYPPACPTRLITPGPLRLNRVTWLTTGAHVTGTVGNAEFEIEVTTEDLLNRKRFAFSLWRYRHLLPILPSISDWQGAIAHAEREVTS